MNWYSLYKISTEQFAYPFKLIQNKPKPPVREEPWQYPFKTRQKKPYYMPPARPQNLPYGYWIAPNGTTIPVGDQKHEEIAQQKGFGVNRNDALDNGYLRLVNVPDGRGITFNKWPTKAQYQKASEIFQESGATEWEVNGRDFKGKQFNATVKGPEQFTALIQNHRMPEGTKSDESLLNNQMQQVQDLKGKANIGDIAYRDEEEDANPWNKMLNKPKQLTPEEQFLRMIGQY